MNNNLDLTKDIINILINKCGIYAFYREDNIGFKYAYIGQSVNCLQRVLEHISSFSQHIDCSIKKRGLYDKETNPYGYKIILVEECSEQELNEKEIHYCLKYAYAGYQLLNKTGGSQSIGKQDLDTGERKPAKTYRDGLIQGYKNCIRDINKLINKKLIIQIDGKITKTKQKAYNTLIEKLQK